MEKTNLQEKNSKKLEWWGGGEGGVGGQEMANRNKKSE